MAMPAPCEVLTFPFGCMFWYYRQVEQCLAIFSLSAFRFTKYTNSCTSNHFSLFPCSCFVAVSISASAIEMMLLLTCLSWLWHLSWPNHVQWTNIFVCLSTYLFCADSPAWYMPLALADVYPFSVPSCIFHIDEHIGRSNAVSIALTLMLRPHISLSLFSSWLCHDSQSAMNSLRPGLYSMHTLYQCLCRIMHCGCCDHVATSLPIMDTNGLWYVMTCTSFAKQ